jgi:hypothetical protein
VGAAVGDGGAEGHRLKHGGVHQALAPAGIGRNTENLKEGEMKEREIEGKRVNPEGTG